MALATLLHLTHLSNISAIGSLVAFFEHILLNILENKGLRILNIVQSVGINLYFHIPSKTQFRQKCHLRPSCIQPTIYI